jgi:hypothetical protein
MELTQACYEGMLKKLTQTDNFLYYTFKHWIWPRHAGKATRKKKRVRYGARLFVDETGEPWLYIFDPKKDSANDLEKGELDEVLTSDDSVDTVSESDSGCGHVHDNVDTTNSA